jgi:hypothetical protein
MENQHRKINGYRELTQQEIDAMNSVKALEKDALELMKQLGDVPGIDRRRLALASTNIEQGCMWAVKAVARPGEG